MEPMKVSKGKDDEATKPSIEDLQSKLKQSEQIVEQLNMANGYLAGKLSGVIDYIGMVSDDLAAKTRK